MPARNNALRKEQAAMGGVQARAFPFIATVHQDSTDSMLKGMMTMPKQRPIKTALLLAAFAAALVSGTILALEVAVDESQVRCSRPGPNAPGSEGTCVHQANTGPGQHRHAEVEPLTGGRFKTLGSGVKVCAESARIWKEVPDPLDGAAFLQNPS